MRNELRLLGNSGLRVSELSLGTMTFGEEWGWGSGKDEARKLQDNMASLEVKLSPGQVASLD